MSDDRFTQDPDDPEGMLVLPAKKPVPWRKREPVQHVSGDEILAWVEKAFPAANKKRGSK